MSHSTVRKTAGRVAGHQKFGCKRGTREFNFVNQAPGASAAGNRPKSIAHATSWSEPPVRMAQTAQAALARAADPARSLRRGWANGLLRVTPAERLGWVPETTQA